jgi:hypothetical protein
MTRTRALSAREGLIDLCVRSEWDLAQEFLRIRPSSRWSSKAFDLLARHARNRFKLVVRNWPASRCASLMK